MSLNFVSKGPNDNVSVLVRWRSAAWDWINKGSIKGYIHAPSTQTYAFELMFLFDRSESRWGQHDSGYPALMGAPDNITVTVTTARHYYELFSS